MFGNEVREEVFLTYNFENKKVIDLVMTIKRTPDGERIYYIVFMTDTNDLMLIKHIMYDQRVYTNQDTKRIISLDNSLRHIRGYYRS